MGRHPVVWFALLVLALLLLAVVFGGLFGVLSLVLLGVILASVAVGGLPTGASRWLVLGGSIAVVASMIYFGAAMSVGIDYADAGMVKPAWTDWILASVIIMACGVGCVLAGLTMGLSRARRGNRSGGNGRGRPSAVSGPGA